MGSAEKFALKWFLSQILKKVREYNTMDIGGKNILRRGNSQCRCPEAGRVWWVKVTYQEGGYGWSREKGRVLGMR